jgi:integrase
MITPELALAKVKQVCHRIKYHSVPSHMKHQIKLLTRDNNTRKNYNCAARCFDRWRRKKGLSNRQVFENPLSTIQAWTKDMYAEARLSDATIKGYLAGICKAWDVQMPDVGYRNPVLQRKRSRGMCERSKKARVKPKNALVVAFQLRVGVRRSELEHLEGKDYCNDESGRPCVVVRKGKGGKRQYQVIAPEDVPLVQSYFANCAPDQRLFPVVDSDLDIQGMRIEHARAEYDRVAELLKDESNRAKARELLWARFHHSEYGCKAWRIAKEKGNRKKMRRCDERFAQHMKDGIYRLRGQNKLDARKAGRPTEYDRLTLLYVSVFCLSHWRNDVTVKYYMI